MSAMGTQNWVTLIACVGELAVVVLVALRGSGSSLATPLLFLSVDFFTWNFGQLAYHRSGDVRWHLLDMIASPLGIVLGLHFMLSFVGRTRQMRWPLRVAYLYWGLLAGSAVVGLLSPAARPAVLGALAGTWSYLFLGGFVPVAAFLTVLLVQHLRRVGSVEERSRTWLLLGALLVISPLASTENWADLGYRVPRLGSVGVLGFNALVLLAALRFRLFDRALLPSAALSATIIAAVGAVAYLSVFHAAGTNTALLVFGTLTVTMVLLAAFRLIVGTMASRRDQTVRLAALGRLAAQMGHDLKNPLAALKGAAQYLREERSQGRSIDDKIEFLDLMNEQIDRLENAVDKYHRLGRIEAMRAPVQLNELVRNLVTLQKFGAADQVVLRADLATDLPECPVDRDLVAGALENLLQNAFEATPRAAVTVRTSLLRTSKGHGIVLSVEDTGVGMSARTRERALDDFYTTKATGSGLGLAFVRRVAEAHGGEVSLTSREGAGTTVRLFFPLESS